MKNTGAAIVLFAIAVAILAGLLPVAWLGIGEGTKALDAYTLRVIAFTLWQALLSTAMSAALGVAAAFALARRKFWGRAALIRLLALPMALPAIVVVLGLIGIFGAEGPLAGIVPLYGLTGILLAHVFFNAPLVARLTLSALATVPPEQLRLAAQLGFSDIAHLRHVDWPVLRQTLPGTLLLVFLLCAASFTIVLTLGGGPQATTLEVAIYQALRFDFDPARATLLALMQITLCGLLGFGVLRFSSQALTQDALRLTHRRHDGQSVTNRVLDVFIILLLVALLLPPLMALAASGITALSLQAAFFTALATSFGLAVTTAIISSALAWMLATAPARLSTLASQAGFILPPAVIATGWFILVSKGPGLSPLALLLIIALNSLMALPFAYGVLAPALRGLLMSHGRLCDSLGISGWNRLRHIDLPAAKAPLSLALAMAALVSLGDLSAILFFGGGKVVTLPALIYQQMASYRMQGAMGTALVLALLSFAVLWAAEHWSKRHA
jgi:thiamine transport system permease protein